ncbi:mechanosensitive ion channel family protein [Lewinella cohaerens]|uniref:mechanosensitive ion channel family protein n=1 Tax=Lewinella cohaerens TaxID=70995 RepID=UPI00035E6528|nr:mechanosensitive ion channel family protein [Lewinella cohaerens]
MEEQVLEHASYYGLAVGILIGTVILAALVGRFFRSLIKRSTDEMKNDPTNYLFLRHLIIGVIYLVGIGVAVYTVPELRGLASSMLAGAGILAVAVGFASQHALSNIISGMFIVIFKPFRVNDRITVRDMSGVIEDITLRHTVIRNFENRRIIIPNALISDEIVVNADFGDGKICKWIEIGISYESDIDLAKQIMREETMAHPLLIDNRNAEQIAAGEPVVMVRLLALQDSGILLRAWAWTEGQADSFVLGCDLYESIKKRFDREGIEIPYPHRTIVQKTKS